MARREVRGVRLAVCCAHTHTFLIHSFHSIPIPTSRTPRLCVLVLNWDTASDSQRASNITSPLLPVQEQPNGPVTCPIGGSRSPSPSPSASPSVWFASFASGHSPLRCGGKECDVYCTHRDGRTVQYVRDGEISRCTRDRI